LLPILSSRGTPPDAEYTFKHALVPDEPLTAPCCAVAGSTSLPGLPWPSRSRFPGPLRAPELRSPTAPKRSLRKGCPRLQRAATGYARSACGIHCQPHERARYPEDSARDALSIPASLNPSTQPSAAALMISKDWSAEGWAAYIQHPPLCGHQVGETPSLSRSCLVCPVLYGRLQLAQSAGHRRNLAAPAQAWRKTPRSRYRALCPRDDLALLSRCRPPDCLHEAIERYRQTITGAVFRMAMIRVSELPKPWPHLLLWDYLGIRSSPGPPPEAWRWRTSCLILIVWRMARCWCAYV